MTEPNTPHESDGSDDRPNDWTPTVRSIGPDELTRVEVLLANHDLPHRDIRAAPISFVGVAVSGDLVGVGGLERYDTVGLLRSVVIEESFQGRGLGTRLCDELETQVRETGIESLYLLTTTAADFFRARGYDEVDRSAAPSSIQNTTEFGDLCPESATCMHKSLR